MLFDWRMKDLINLGTLKEITDLRSVWPHEALNFTPWVAENVDLLADAVGLDIKESVDNTCYKIFHSFSQTAATTKKEVPANFLTILYASSAIRSF